MSKMADRLTLKEAAGIKDTLVSGHRLCAGCGHPIIARMIMKAASDIPTIVTNATGCLEVATTIFPFTSWIMVVSHILFGMVAGGVYELLEVEEFEPVIREAGEGA